MLLQLVAKRLLTDYSRKFAKADAGALARYVVTQAAGKAYHGTGLRSVAQTVARLRLDRPLGQLAAGAERRSASCSPTASRR